MKLFEPQKIGNIKIKNRITMAPMGIGGLVNFDGSLSQRGIDYFVERAKGGVGLIRVGFTRTTREFEQILNTFRTRHLFVDDRLHIKWLNEIAELVHDYGTKISIQLSAGVGRIAGGELQIKGKPIAPSALKCFWPPHKITNELSINEIERLVNSFELSASLIKKAGLDAIEIHGHEGYLFDQFITELWNKRNDKYGGSIENRLRFPIEVIKAIKKGAGEDFPIIYRFGLSHYLDGGREIEEGFEIAKLLEQAGVDALDIDAGCYETWYLAHPPSTIQPGFKIDLAEMVKRVVSIPVIAGGKLGYPDLAEKVLQENKADFISLGRALLADPEWPNKVKQDKKDDIRYCIGCHEGCLQRIFDSKYISCAVNPATGNEARLTIKPSNRKKNILIVGGGVAGLEAARVSAIRGHKVTLWEKEDYLGGNFKVVSIPDFKNDYKLLVEYLINQIKKLNVDVKLNCYANQDKIQQMNPEVVILANGSISDIPDIPGLEKEDIIFARDIFLKNKSTEKNVAIIGGGLIGCETALYLALKSKKVTILESKENVCNNMFLANRMHLLKLLKENNVTILNNAKITQINKKEITFYNSNIKDKLLVDSIVIATGLKANNSLFENLKKTEIEVYKIGDCVKPRKVINAIWEAYRTARII